ncbi:HTH-type transcriptional activator Btr [Pontiella desulfatans]|uniref:HTH-type transcriptional activator Btr n=1 Tax=Pontiella desulfatans TaxID=2750659 RepID=A0A6C2TY58_PONDE|nr:AraC family transcriptional regulator [Pontiella desulfatans]VGO12384.1 HTH-type transcriptional activator Btr [Pontiella desulfatans]
MSRDTQSKETLIQECDAFRESLHGAQLKQLLNFLPGIYFVVKNFDGRVMMANDEAARLCGFENETEMLGKTDYDIFASDRADTYVKDDQHVLQTGESIIDRVEMAPDPNNSINWFVTTKIPLYSHENEIVGLACIARNMTDAYEMLRPYTEMNEVLEYVRENYATPIKLEDLAREASLSPSQFERSFKKLFEITPARHILNVRIRAACNLLSSSNDTIASIAMETGFYDHSHFARGFKKVMGISAGEYRSKGRKSPW